MKPKHWMVLLEERLNQGRIEKVPPGWEDVKTIAQKNGLSRRAAQNRISKMVAAGLLDVRVFRTSPTHKVQHFKPKA
jgi:hypothetical protein